MAIAGIDIYVTSPGRNFVTLRAVTDDGVVGWGDATLNGRELTVAAELLEHLAPLMMGRDESAIQDTWQYLYRGVYWRGGPVAMTAIAAVDMALWDIKAKRAGMPLYQLIGGASRTGLLAYGHASGSSVDALCTAIDNQLDEGLRAVRVQGGIPGLGQIYGLGSDQKRGEKYFYEPAKRHSVDGRAVPAEEVWDTPAYLAFVPRMLDQVRERYGEDLPLLHDVHHRLRPHEAARLARDVEPHRLFWLEDCTPAEDQEALRLVRQHSTTPLAIGEVLSSAYDYRQLISERLIDYVRSSPTHAGGITGLKRILDWAGLYGIRSGMHGPTDVSPIGYAAGLHLGLAIHNFGIQEYMPHSAATLEAFRPTWTFADGLLHPGEEPGLGVDPDPEQFYQHAHHPAYLPVARLRDGTIHDW